MQMIKVKVRKREKAKKKMMINWWSILMNWMMKISNYSCNIFSKNMKRILINSHCHQNSNSIWCNNRCFNRNNNSKWMRMKAWEISIVMKLSLKIWIKWSNRMINSRMRKGLMKSNNRMKLACKMKDRWVRVKTKNNL